MIEKRKKLRRDYLARVVVKLKTSLGANQELRRMITERSKSGFGVLVANPIPTGCVVQLEQGRQAYSGIVRHCYRSKAEYHVGIELDPATK